MELQGSSRVRADSLMPLPMFVTSNSIRHESEELRVKHTHTPSLRRLDIRAGEQDKCAVCVCGLQACLSVG